MNDKLQQLYNLYKQKGIISTTDFNTFASADESQRQKLYDIGVQKGLFNTTDFNTFNNAWGGEKKSVASAAKAGALEASKKKDSTVLDSKSGKPTSVSSSNANKKPTPQELNKGITWVGNEKEQKEYLKSLEGTSDYSKARKIGDEFYEGEGEIFTNYPGKEGKAYRYYNKQWYEYSSTIPGKNGDITQLKKPITDPTRISNLNKEFNKEGTTEKGVYIGFPQKEQNEYKVVNGQWKKRTPENRTWVTVTNEGSIGALNRQFKQNVSKISDENLLKQIKADNGYSLYFDKSLNKIDTKLISKSEEEVVAELNGIFPVGSGWKFEQYQAGADRIRITAPNGQKEVFILDNWSTSEDKSQAIKMRTWMAKNNLTPSEYERNKELKKKLSEEQRFTGPTSLGDREAMEAQDVVMRQNLATELGLKPNLTEEEAMMLQKVKTAKAEAKPARLEVLTEKSRKAAEIQEQYKEYLLDPSGLSQSKIIEARQALAALAQDKSTIAQASRFVDDINERSKAYKQEFDIVESQIKNSATELVNKYKSGQITYDEYLLEFKELEKKTKEIQGELKLKESEIQNQIKLSDKIASQANQSLGENYALKQEAGSFGGAMTLGFIKGAASPFRLLGGVMGEGMTADEWHKAVSDAVSPFWDYQTSLEYIRSEEHSDLYKAAFSVSESLGAMAPAFLTGGSTALGTSLLARGAAGTATFFPLMYYELKDEMENIDMPESHKMLLASLYGVIGGALESFGMEYAMGKINSTVGANIKRNILKNVLGKTIPKNAPREFIDALVQTETRAYLSSLGLGVLESGAVEGVTEGLQSLTGASIQEIYDRVGNKTELFNNQGLQEVFSTALYETYLGALGGHMVSTVYSAGSAMKRGVLLNSEELSTLMAAAKTNGMSETLMTNLKADILNERITLKQAKEIANNFQVVQSKVNEIPENLTVEAQSVSLGLLMEREKLNQQIEGKDPNLVKPLKERVDEINKRLQELSTDYAVQEQATGEVPVQSEAAVSGEVAQRAPETTTEQVTKEGGQANLTKEEIEARRKETEAKIKRKDLFDGVGKFSSRLGGSDMDAVPVSHNEKNGIEIVEFAHPKTGSVDVVITGTSNNDFVGFYRIYENGKPTNRWSSKFENQSRNKENFKTMIGSVQELLPEGHEYTEKTSISTDGLRVWNQQLNKGYELQYDENGNVVTNEVAINGDAIVNELGIPVNKGKFQNINVTSEADFQKVKEALLPYLEKFGLNESNIRWMSGPLKTSGTVKIDLPVLRKSTTQTGTSAKTQTTEKAQVVEETQQPATEEAKVVEQDKQEAINYEKEFIEKTINESKEELKNTSRFKLRDRAATKLTIRQNNKKLALLESNPKQYFENELKRYNKNPEKYAPTIDRIKKNIELFSQETPATAQAVTPQVAPVTTPQVAPITIEPKLEAQLNKLYDKQESGKPLTPKQQQFVEKNQKAYDQVVSSRTLQEQTSALDALISGQTQGPAFQLQEEGKGQELKKRKEKIKERKEDLVEKATKEMERVQPEIADEAYEAQEPTKGTVKVEIKENEPLTEGIPRKSIKDFIGKKINLLMADLLKVDLNNKIKKMGGVFFPLIPGLRGKIAWASIDLEAAKRIVRGAIKSQFSMVYNMNPEAMMSNKVFLESVLDRISNLPNANVVFNQMMERIQGLSYQTDTEQIHKVARESKTMAEFKKNFGELNVDQKAAIMRSILPEQGTDYSGSKIDVFKTLSNEGITKESMIAENVEQFAADLPPGALTMVLEIVDENGNRPTEETIDNFILTKAQAKEMGLPIHENYPIYIKGKVNSILTETTSFWDVLKDFKRSVDAKIANLIQKKDTYIVEREVTDKKGNKKKVDVAVKVYNNPNGTRTVEVFNSTEVKGEGKKTTIDALEKEGTDLFISANIGKIKSYKEGGLYTAKEARSSTMRSASMKADSAFEVTEATKSKYQQFVERLMKAFPTVEVATSQEEFDAMIDEIKTKAVGNKVLLTKNQNVYGAVYNGKLYLNPNLENYNTPIHEFGHIWLNVAKTMRPDLYNKGLSLIRNSEYLNDVKNSPEYNRIVKAMKAQGFSEQEIEQYLEEEALATAIGDKGESFVTAASKRSFNNWLNNVFDFVKKLTGISNVTSEQLQDMTLDEFVQGVVVDLMSENQQFKDAEIESFGNQLQLMTGPAGLSMQDIISMGRAYGFSDAAIKQSLLNQGFRATEINNMLAVQLNLVESMPTAFANVDGGMTVGLQMYNDVKQELEDYSRGETTTTRAPRMTKQERTARIAELRKQNPTLTELSDSELLRRFPRPAQASTTTTTRPTLSEIRAKAMELIKAHPTFQAQKETVQMELLSAFDKTLGTRANKVIQQQINAIRNNLKQRKIGAKELQDAKVVLRNFIKNVLPKSEVYSSVDVNKLLNLIAKSTEATIMKDTNTVLDIVEKQREKMKTNVIRDMFAMVAKKGKVGKTTTGKRRSAGLEETGQAFFEAAKGILKAVIKGNTTFLDAVKQELESAEQDGRMASAIYTKLNGEKLTVKEQDLLNKAHAYGMFINLNDMQLEEVQDVFSVLKGMRTQSIMDLESKRLQRAAEYMAVNEQATEQVQKLNSVLYKEETDENGNVKMIPKNQNELNRDKKEVYEFIRKGRIGKAIRSAKKNWNFKSPRATKRFFNNYMKHLGTIMNMFDNKAKGMTFFTDNVYKPLNRMDESAKSGYQNQMQTLNSIANTINGITRGYVQIRNMVQSKPFFTVQDKNGNIDRFTMEQVLRIYALSKNNVQREILRKQGITDSVLDSMVKALPSPAVEFADKIVDYLSNQYYESVNDVYSSVNDINLGRVENYFPTAKVDPNKAIDFNPEDPNFSGIFNAETAPSLHERVDNKSDIDLNHDFFEVLDNHMNNMERYKAYAEGVKKLNAVFQNENVSAMLNGTKTKALVKNLINYAITPNFGLSQQDTIVGKIMNKFTGFALAFKLVQIPKQASSFVQAFEDYSYFGKDSKVPRVIRKPIDVLGFMVDTAITAATIRSTVKELYSSSANLRDRLEKGIKGDVYSLESGARLFRPIDKRSDAYGKISRGVKSAAAAPTVIGDVLGVMGYAVNYKRNIKNGMSKEEALEAFTDYNATQQTRRGTERNMLQNNKSELVRVFTMFGSTSFLMLNKVMQANHNIKNSLLEKQMPESKDMRALVLNLGAANAFFVLAANLAKYALGDDDDKEAVIAKMKKAMYGFNLIAVVPFINETFQEVLNYVEGTQDPSKMGTNPFMSVWWKVLKGLKEEDVIKIMQPLVELGLGTQIDPFIGLYNILGGDFDDSDVYDALGISKSYRPTPNELRDELTKEGYSPEEIEQAIQDDKYMKAMDSADRKLNKELNKIDDKLENGEITEKEYNELYQEIEDEHEETLKEIEEEFSEE